MALALLNLLSCPYCHGELSEIKDGLLCQGCNKIFPIINGIPSFVSETNQFYEGRFISTSRVFINPMLKFLYDVYTSISIDCSLERFLKKVFKNRSDMLILDLGCGGGRQYLTQFGDVVGVDISLQSLQNARAIYTLTIHSNAYNLPFLDNSFDMVCSFGLIGHVPLENKGELLSEIYRVMKEGGFTAHNIECDSQSILFRWARQYPDLYQKYFVEMYRHYGLELPIAAFDRFRQAGFTPVIERADACKTVLRPVHSYAIFFDNEFKTKSYWVRMLATASRPFRQHTILRLLANFLLGCFVPLSDLLISTNSRDSIQVLYRRERKAR